MTQQRKTVDVYEIQGRYAGGFECVCEEFHFYTARQSLRTYRENETSTEFRIVKKRVRKDSLDEHRLTVIETLYRVGEDEIRQVRLRRRQARAANPRQE